MKALKVVYFAGLAAWLALAGVLVSDVLPEMAQRVAGAAGARRFPRVLKVTIEIKSINHI